MPNSSTSRRPLIAVIILCLLVLIFLIGFFLWHKRQLPQPGSVAYAQIVSVFYKGVLALDVGDDDHAPSYLQQATHLAPQEPAAWANLGLFELRHNNYPQANTFLSKARDLAPNNAQIASLLGLLEQTQSHYDAAITDLRRAITLDPNNDQARYTLVQTLSSQGGAGNDAAQQEQLEAILKSQPDNLFVQAELVRMLANGSDKEKLRTLTAQMQTESSSLPLNVRQHLTSLQKTATGPNPHDAYLQVIMLENLLTPDSAYQRGRSVIGITAVGQAGQPLEQFLVLPPPPATPAAPDIALTFSPKPITTGGSFHPTWAARLALNPAGPLTTVLADGKQIQITGGQNLTFPGGSKSVTPIAEGVLAVDWNNDSLPDLVVGGGGGVRLYQQQKDSTFKDVTAGTKLPPNIINGAYTGAWAADIDTDGDLDIVLGTVQGTPTVLRNNGDGTFTPQPFPLAPDGLTQFVWADLDGDGMPDAAFLDGKGQLVVLENKRNGRFTAWPVPANLGPVAALTAADITREGRISLVVLKQDGTVQSLTRNGDDSGWDTADLTHWTAVPTDGSARLRVADFDNNGGLDLLATGSSGSQVWLSDSQGKLSPLSGSPQGNQLTVDAEDEQGHINLTGLTPDGKPAQFLSHGAKSYKWQDVRLAASPIAKGDDRNNSFGVGGTIALRAGLLYEDQRVTSPVVHFGLGTYPESDLIRIVWPNGAPQGEFGLTPEQVVHVPQRLTGSCPWLFADNGHGMNFVTDLIWRSPLGLRINAQVTAGVAQTRDWVKIRGDQLAPKDGYYNLAVTADLWETHFFDQVSLMTVDHPANTDIWVDERFAIPPPPLKIYPMTPSHPVMKATDDRGQDVTDVVQARDGKYLDTFGRGQYQGITRDHWVEMDLGPEAEKVKGPLWLLAYGWVHPTDSSINVAVGQGHHAPPTSLILEIPDGQGKWRAVRRNLGFPEGKNKTCLVNLTGLFAPGQPRRVRLRTNLEIYWDQLSWATETPQQTLKTQMLSAGSADLHYRGFSATHQANASSPEIPDYGHVEATGPRWLDLVGFYTRYGDVRPLLAKTDDRYVIMNAGDEMTLRFAVPPPPPPGWTRDFVLVCDGWVKDGNLNTTFSKTVLPLPAHDPAIEAYNTPPGRLEDDPVYKKHKRDWQLYQTRYVDQRAFQNALLPRGTLKGEK